MFGGDGPSSSVRSLSCIDMDDMISSACTSRPACILNAPRYRQRWTPRRQRRESSAESCHWKPQMHCDVFFTQTPSVPDETHISTKNDRTNNPWGAVYSVICSANERRCFANAVEFPFPVRPVPPMAYRQSVRLQDDWILCVHQLYRGCFSGVHVLRL